MSSKHYRHTNIDGKPRINLFSPTYLPNTSHFLWNKNMVLQANCRGYVISQFMQPEPAKYSHAPLLEAKTFIQPEQPFYTEHPARFVFIKNEVTGEVLSAPYEPMKSDFDAYCFSSGTGDISWQVSCFGIELKMTLSLTTSDNIELWKVEVVNHSGVNKSISIYPYFTVGYMSWMNQSAEYNESLNAIVASSITPYQKVEQYFQNQELKDKTCLIADKTPTSWTTSFADFVGVSGLTDPESLKQATLNNLNSHYETPAAVMHFSITLDKDEKDTFKFVFGPAKDESEITELRKYLDKDAFSGEVQSYQTYVDSGKGCLTISSPDKALNEFVNHWLPRQMFYHGDVNRLSTDPQTRNFVQDAMSMIYITPNITRERLIFALSQQKQSGQMPDGILLSEQAELKYINQVPHADHCVWVPICLLAYLDETNDVSILKEQIKFADSSEPKSLSVHIELAIEWLLSSTDHRGLSLIEQGDWCDPMNMVGYKGKGVSSWLTIATLYALNCWLDICENYSANNEYLANYSDKLKNYQETGRALKDKINQYFWDNKWFARGITDDGNLFGIEQDQEGQMFINPQSWSMLAKVPNNQQLNRMLREVNQRLVTPYGVTMLAPSYTQMREDVGRVTQKSAGVAENGAVYNHAAAFYAYALYQNGFNQQGFDVLRRMLPDANNIEKMGQLPLYIPNYYRGAYYQHPEYAGRSSQLFNTGTVAWYYKSLVDGLCGMSGRGDGLIMSPNLPESWTEFKVTRTFRGADFHVDIRRKPSIKQQETIVDGELLQQPFIRHIESGKKYQVEVYLPKQEIVLPKLTIVMGVSGCGKSTVAKQLAEQFNHVYMDADDFHSTFAKQKMQQGKALTDEERLPWINRMLQHLQMLQQNGQSVVLAYSGLKHEHRDMFRTLSFELNFFRLNVDATLLEQRLLARTSHFFEPNLLQSQLLSMEGSHSSETDIVDINANDNLITVIADINKELNHE